MDAAVLVRRARARGHLTLRELAERAGTSHATLSAYETGRKVPTVATLDRILRAAGVEVADELAPVPGGADVAARGRELIDALELAAMFPARHETELTFPRFGADRRAPVRRWRVSRGGSWRSTTPSTRRGSPTPSAAPWRWRGAPIGPAARSTSTSTCSCPPTRPSRSSVRSRRRSRPPPSRSNAWGGDGQVRLWWATTPVDVFLDTSEFHRRAADRARWEDFGGHLLPFLACADLAVFKAFFDRTKDWADLEEMAAAGALDVDRALGVLVRYLGADDHRVARLADLAGPL